MSETIIDGIRYKLYKILYTNRFGEVREYVQKIKVPFKKEKCEKKSGRPCNTLRKNLNCEESILPISKSYFCRNLAYYDDRSLKSI